MELSWVFRLTIIFICSGVVVLGANDLYLMHKRKKIADLPAGKILNELRDDPYARLTSGASLETVGVREKEVRKARYPWEKNDLQDDEQAEKGIFSRLRQALFEQGKTERVK